MNRRDFLKTSFLGALAVSPLAKTIAAAAGSSEALPDTHPAGLRRFWYIGDCP